MNKSEILAEYPDLYREIQAEGLAQASGEDIIAAHPDLATQLKAEGGTEERNRIEEIREAAFEGQEDLAAELIDKGVSTDQARKNLIANQKTRTEKALEKIVKDDPGDVGANPAEQETKPAAETAKTKQEAGDKLDEIARGFVKDDGINYTEAIDRAEKENPELAKVYNG